MKKLMKKINSFFNKIKKETITEEEKEAVIKETKKTLEKIQTETLNTFPIWMKTNVLMNWINEGKLTNEQIDWNYINQVLHTSTQEIKIDYNIFDEISSIEELSELRDNSNEAAYIETVPFYQETCKKCGKTFTLTRNEINFFLNHDLQIPKRCYACRKGIIPEKIKPERNKEEDEKVKTEMFLALEKAGFKIIEE